MPIISYLFGGARMTAWFNRSFGPDYMVIYRHRNCEQAAKEARQMASWLELPPEARLLDIGCGMGRHALALAEQGYCVTGIDLSEALLEEARLHGNEHGVSYVQGDMRRLPFAAGQFRATVNLFTSFGYFYEEVDNWQVLKEVRRVLSEEGQFLIDYLNPAYVRAHLIPYSQRRDEESGLCIEEQRLIDKEWVVKRIAVRPPEGGIRCYEERVRLYSLSWFEQAFGRCGLRLERIYGGYDGSAYDEKSSARMIMTGRVLR